MRVLLLCGYVEEQFEDIVAGVEQAANLYQRKLIGGLRSHLCRLSVISVPYCGAWPIRSKMAVFRGFQSASVEKITYVPFHNLWGWRSISRARSLKKPVDHFIQETQGEKRAIIVYAPHTPFLYAAVRAKRKAPDLHISLIVPDLPQYMNLNTSYRRFYDFCKYFDIRFFEKLNREVDSYLLLTRAMADVLHTGSRPCVIAEGLADTAVMPLAAERTKTFVYAGKLVRRFGVDRLLQAFSQLDDETYRLIICGTGEMRPDVEHAAQQDRRICYMGVVPHNEMVNILRGAGVLVNPRAGGDIYTRYSFPSKVMEYLQTGLPVVSECLSGMPEVYRQLLYCPEDGSVAALAQAMRSAMQTDYAVEYKRQQAARAYLCTLTPSCVAGKLLAMIEGKEVASEC